MSSYRLLPVFLTLVTVLSLSSSAQEEAATTSEPAIEETEKEDAATGTIILRIDGLKKKRLRGDVRCRVYNSEETFPSKEEDQMFRLVVVPANAESLEVVLEDLPYGEYGIIIHHDRNSNGRMDRRWYGPPAEPVGCSRDARGNFGPPKWEDAVFELNQSSLEIPIHVK